MRRKKKAVIRKANTTSVKTGYLVRIGLFLIGGVGKKKKKSIRKLRNALAAIPVCRNPYIQLQNASGYLIWERWGKGRKLSLSKSVLLT